MCCCNILCSVFVCVHPAKVLEVLISATCVLLRLGHYSHVLLSYCSFNLTNVLYIQVWLEVFTAVFWMNSFRWDIRVLIIPVIYRNIGLKFHLPFRHYFLLIHVLLIYYLAEYFLYTKLFTLEKIKLCYSWNVKEAFVHIWSEDNTFTWVHYFLSNLILTVYSKHSISTSPLFHYISLYSNHY
jgi:hypothetical protein